MPIARGVNTYINDKGETKPIDIYYCWHEPTGPANGEVVVHVTGLGCQLLHSMYNTFVAPLLAQGYRVLRFDNRDSGKSTKLSDLSHKSFIAERLRCRLSDQTVKHQLNYGTPYNDKAFENKTHPIFTTPHSLHHDGTLGHDNVDITMWDCSNDIVVGARPINFMSRVIGGNHAVAMPLSPSSPTAEPTSPSSATTPSSPNYHPHRAQFPHHEPRGFFNKIGLGKRLPCYEISDQAMDVVLLLNQLGVDRFHISGVSMGGMISQYVAALIPSRVLSLSLVMTTTGNTWHNATMKFLLGTLVMRKAPAADAPIAEIIAFAKETQELIGVNYPDIERSYNNHQDWDSTCSGMIRRAPRDEKAVMRQMEAIDGQESRDYILDYLAARMPIFIWHGRQDQLVPFSNAVHMMEIAKQSLMRQINPPRVRHPDDTAPQPEPFPLDIVTTTEGRREVTSIIGRPYGGRRPFTTVCMVDKAAHDITDDAASFLMPHHMAFMDAAMGRANILQPLVLPVPQWGNEPDIAFDVPPPEDQVVPEAELAGAGDDFDHLASPPPPEVAQAVPATTDVAAAPTSGADVVDTTSSPAQQQPQGEENKVEEKVDDVKKVDEAVAPPQQEGEAV